MCRPDFYSISYEINPWMNINNPANSVKAYTDWGKIYNTIKSLGANISLIEPAEGLPDMVFTANAALIHGNKVIMGSFKYKEREGEEPHYIKWFSGQGYNCHRLPDGLSFEGEGDTVYYKDIVLLGHGFRTDILSHPYIGDITGRKYTSLKLIDPHFYHLDTCLLFIEAIDLILYYPQAFDQKSIKEIDTLPSKTLRISKEDARLFALNSICIGMNLLLYKCTDALACQLREYGLSIISLDTSEFIKSGGSVRCMVLRLS